MNRVLIYSRMADPSLDLLCEQLSSIGISNQQTQHLNAARLLLESAQVVHVFIEAWPLTVRELVFLSLASALGRAVVVSVFNSHQFIGTAWYPFFKPDAFTVSQTNHLKFYRQMTCVKMILAKPLRIKKNSSPLSFNPHHQQSEKAFFIPLYENLNEVDSFQSEHCIFIDGRRLLKKQTASEIRKAWNEKLKNNQLSNQFQLILSDSKFDELITDMNLTVVLAHPQWTAVELNTWFSLTLNKKSSLIINDFQATSHSQIWKNNENCQIISAKYWLKDLNLLFKKPSPFLNSVTMFDESVILEPVTNELSRLYTKIIRQKTSFISSSSAKV